MNKRLIANARVVNEGSTQDADVLIADGRIQRIDTEISADHATDVVDAEGRYLLPGLIDDQVHFREPGLTTKADIHSESAAAIAGGVTSFMEMPNVKPPTVTVARVEQKNALARDRSYANYAFYLGATNDNQDDIIALSPDQVCGLKVFMGASTGNMLVDDPKTLATIFAHCPVPVVTHCEDTPTILHNEQIFRERYGEDVPIGCHPEIRSVEACYKSSSLAVQLAREHGTQLHVLHLSSARELELFSSESVENKRITVEACVHHLYFDARDYADKGALIKCNPAIKNASDKDALLAAVVEGRIDVIATDHAPHTLQEKQRQYFDAPSGLPLVQHSLQTLLEHFHRGRFSLELIVEKACHAPAKVFSILERGFIREGFWADLVLIDLDRPYTVTRDNTLYKCGWSPFEGHTFESSVYATFVNGQLAYRDGTILTPPSGQLLAFSRTAD
ncbi:MAG: dihydroorotase [Gammaproteobacteria bacterium]|nr:dihydroorotase [Gammaproteobacteria bacterium]